MNLRHALYDLSARYGLDPSSSRQLHQLAALDEQPAQLPAQLARGMAILAASLFGLGLIFWVAANWESLGRFGRFALLQGCFLVMCVGALYRPAARTALALLALLTIGGLFAYFGQTYQTGADPWQLFALWAVLGLPLCLAVRSDVLWTPWSIVIMAAISLWVHAHTGHEWRLARQDLLPQLIGWSLALLVTLAMSPVLGRFTGAQAWSMRSSLTQAVLLIAFTAVAALFHERTLPQYWIALVLLGAFAGLFATRRFFDIYALSAVGMALNGLLIAGVAKAIDLHGVDAMFIIGVFAAFLLSGTVSAIMRLSRHLGVNGGAA